MRLPMIRGPVRYMQQLPISMPLMAGPIYRITSDNDNIEIKPILDNPLSAKHVNEYH